MNLDIIHLLQTWCKDMVANTVLMLPGYILARPQKIQNWHCQRYQERTFDFLIWQDWLQNFNKDSVVSEFNQQCNFRIITKDTLLNFVLAYWPPSSWQENTEELCNLLRRLDNNTIVKWDIHMPNIDCSAGRTGARGRTLLMTRLEEDLDQMARFPRNTTVTSWTWLSQTALKRSWP